MTAVVLQLNMPGMASPGRRPSTPKEYKNGFIRRTKAAREAARISHIEIAAALTQRVHRPVVADTYRKYEKDTLLPHDLIVPFCEVTGANLYELLTGAPFKLVLPGQLAARSFAA